MADTLFPVEKKIYDEVCACANGLYARQERSNKVWTAELKQALYQLGKGKDLELEPWGTGSEKSGEWLWDVCWIKVGPQGWRDFRGVYLACEIEWGQSHDALLEDFLKLVAAKANYRLFIFDAGRLDLAEPCFRLLMNACPASEGARYMAIGVMPTKDGGPIPYRAWTL